MALFSFMLVDLRREWWRGMICGLAEGGSQFGFPSSADYLRQPENLDW